MWIRRLDMWRSMSGYESVRGGLSCLSSGNYVLQRFAAGALVLSRTMLVAAVWNTSLPNFNTRKGIDLISSLSHSFDLCYSEVVNLTRTGVGWYGCR